MAARYASGDVDARGFEAERVVADVGIKRAPETSTSVDAGYILGMGCIGSGYAERILILIDIEALMSRAEMGLMDGAAH